jgi:glucose-1-phosphate cytidylyltransferase
LNTVILCGGRGTRLSEETQLKPKPMVEIGGHPILWHIMKIYAAHGLNNFVLALGYKGEVIRDYFISYRYRKTDLTVNLAEGKITDASKGNEDWVVRMIDAGLETLTGGRLHRLEPFLRTAGRFMVTYGDGVANIDIARLLEFHKRHGKLATVTAVRPPARFGTMVFDGDQVTEFKEKPQTGEGWVNGGFFVFEPSIFDYLSGDQTVLEGEPLERLAGEGQLMAFRHEGFWQPMDTLRDRNNLEQMWANEDAPWKIWS